MNALEIINFLRNLHDLWQCLPRGVVAFLLGRKVLAAILIACTRLGERKVRVRETSHCLHSRSSNELNSTSAAAAAVSFSVISTKVIDYHQQALRLPLVVVSGRRRLDSEWNNDC